MHDLALMRDLVEKVETVAREQGAARVRSVRVRLGALSHFTPDHFLEHFEQASLGGPAEGARVEFVISSDVRDPEAQGVVLESLEVASRS